MQPMPIPPRNPLLLASIKLTHTMVFLLSAGAIFYLLWAGISGRLTPFIWVAVAIPALVGLGLKLNGDECILQTWAKRLEGSSEWVSDIYIPDWLSLRVRTIFTPLYVLSLILIIIRLITN